MKSVMDEANPNCEEPALTLTVPEVAKMLRVERKTLYEAIRDGQIPGVMRIGRCIRLRRAVVLAWLSSNERVVLTSTRKPG